VYIYANNVNNESSRKDSRSKPSLCGVADIYNLPVYVYTLKQQSGISSQSLGPSFEKKAITSYSDFNSNTQSVESSPDASYDMAKKEDSDFSNWFERPVKIKEINWAVNGTVAQSFEPWEEWAKDPRIANRLCNFKNFRKVTFEVYLECKSVLLGPCVSFIQSMERHLQ
jgi:hypothetical protein